MKSALLEMKHRHGLEEDKLRKNCKHLPSYIKITLDHSAVGAGSCYPTVVVTCRNCGMQKYIFHLEPKQRKRVKKIMKRQGGFKDERCDCYSQYDSELK